MLKEPVILAGPVSKREADGGKLIDIMMMFQASLGRIFFKTVSFLEVC